MERKAVVALASGTAIGMLGGLIGLGGAEFRLPVLVGLLAMTPRAAVPMNLVITLATLLAALLGRGASLPFAPLLALWPAILGLVAGGVASALWGSGMLVRLSDRRLARVLAVLLTGIGVLLLIEAILPDHGQGLAPKDAAARALIGVACGLLIGAVAALLGVAGGELLIPTFMFVFGADIVLAGTASLLVSLVLVPTALCRYVRLGLLPGPAELKAIAVPMGGGSIAGAVLGAVAVGLVAPAILKLILGIVLIISAIKVFAGRH